MGGTLVFPVELTPSGTTPVTASTDLSDTANLARLDAANVFSHTSGQSAQTLTLTKATGNILVVDTTTLVADATNHKVGIGTATPLAGLHVATASASGTRGIIYSQHNSGTQQPLLIAKKSRGTEGSPTTVVTGDGATAFVSSIYDGTSYVSNSFFALDTVGTIGTNRTPTKMTFSTMTDAATSVQTAALIITEAQTIGMGPQAPTTPDGPLHVVLANSGTVTANGNGNIGVFEASGSNGITILTADASAGTIFFGSPTSNRYAEINANYSGGVMQVGNRRVGGSLQLMSGDAIVALTLSSSQTALFAGAVTGTTFGGTGIITALSGTAPVAAGSQALALNNTASFGVFTGSGVPTVSAAKGSLYLRTDGTGATDRAYINTNGSTTWTAIVTVV